MLAPILFYSALFLALVLCTFAFLLFVDHEHRFWRQFGAAGGPTAKVFRERPSLRQLSARFPGTLSFISRRLDPRDPWELPATLATIAILAGICFFLGIVQDLIGKDPLLTLDVRLHNSVRSFARPA
ncbi:MAG: hypothetical protein ABI349_04520 [Casimicrobiaceae bacterium]